MIRDVVRSRDVVRCRRCGSRLAAFVGLNDRVVYRSPCGCRNIPVDAAILDRFVCTELVRSGLLQPGETVDALPDLAVEVEVGVQPETLSVLVA